jgi:hypothetical protein
MEEKIKLVEFIINNDILVVFLFFIILLFRSPKELIQFLDTWKTSKTSTLDLALKSSYLKGSSRKLIEEKLEQRHFHLSTGLNIEKIVREKILEVYEYCAGEIRFKHFVRACDHYKFKNSTLSVSWGIYQVFFLWFYFFNAVLLSALTLFVFYIIIASFLTSAIIDQVAIKDLFPAAIVLLITTLLSIKSWVTLVSTNMVQKEVTAFNKSNDVSKTNEHSRSSSNF